MNDTAEEWSEMSAQDRQNVLDRLHAVCESRANAAPVIERARLVRASSSGLAARLAQA